MPQLPTILASLPDGKPHQSYLGDLRPLLVSLPVQPTQRNLARFNGRCPHTHGRQAAHAYEFAVLNLAGLYEVNHHIHPQQVG